MGRMLPETVVDGLVIVVLSAFYAGIARDFGTTLEFVDVRLGLGLSLGSYVGLGVGALLAVAVIGLELLAGAGRPGPGILREAFFLPVLFAAAVVLSFRLGTATYGLLLRVGYDIA